MAWRAPCLLTLTVEGVFEDFEGRRAGLVKALTTDVEEFYKQCILNVNLCLFGFPSGKWEVNLPAEMVPPEFPEPALGIKFARDVMEKKDWLSLVAAHSEAWLLAVAYFLGIRIGFDKVDGKRLFHMINDLPSLFEVVTRTAEKEVKKKKSSISKKCNQNMSMRARRAWKIWMVAISNQLRGYSETSEVEEPAYLRPSPLMSKSFFSCVTLRRRIFATMGFQARSGKLVCLRMSFF